MHILTIKVLLIALFAGIALGAAMSTPEGLEYLAANAAKPGVVTLPSGLQYRVLTRSTNSLGVTPNSSSLCHVHYRGTTIKGFEFDSSYKRGKPTKFRPSDVVRGWTEALLMMKEGDKWQLVIPAELAYGKRSMGELITPGSVLVFEIELIQVEEENGSNGIVGSVLKFIPRFLRELPAGVWAVVIAFLYMIIVPESGSSNKTRVPVAQVQGNPCNDRVFVEVKIGDGSPDRVEFELFTAHVPKTATNFLHLCLGDKGTAAKPLSFKNSPFHRVIPNFMVSAVTCRCILWLLKSACITNHFPYLTFLCPTSVNDVRLTGTRR